jgi:pimeloyl-ACP methyl ester carboxylesterase
MVRSGHPHPTETDTAATLPPAVAAALANPAPGTDAVIDAAGIPFHARTWGNEGAPGAPAVLLVHGVTSSAATWWRVGPALAAAGYRVVAPDLPGHGRTGHWTGRHRFRETAEELATFVRAAGLEGGATRCVGHSWGGVTVASLPAAGLIPERIVLLDPPAVSLAEISAMLEDPVERAYDDVDEAIGVVGRTFPTWPYGDVVAKAEGLAEFDEAAVRAVLTENGDWDGGLGALSDPAAVGVPAWLIRGDPDTGGYVPEAVVPAFESRIGAGHVITIPGAPHSPQRTHPEATVRALLQALEG